MKRKFLLFTLFCFFSLSIKAQVSITANNTAYTQDFDSLKGKNGDTALNLPKGWYFSKGGSSSSAYKADDGNLKSDNVYSYGENGSSDRALGTLNGGGINAYIGAAFKNATGNTISSVMFEFTVEQWHAGDTIRHDSSYCEISANATSIDDNSATWVRVKALDLITPNSTNNFNLGAVDGNSSAYQNKISYTLTGLPIINGFTIWVRWRDIPIQGPNDGLAIDDFSLIANPVFTPTISFGNTTDLVKEGDSVKVTLKIRNASTLLASSVDVEIDNTSTATAGKDFKFSKKTITFQANQSSDISFYIPTLEDGIVEGTEKLVLVLKNPSTGTILKDSVMTISILDNDKPNYYYQINEVRQNNSSGVPDSFGKYAILKGVVSSENFETGGIDFYIYDATGSIQVHSNNYSHYAPKIGDSIEVAGSIGFNNGLTNISLNSGTTIDTIILLNSGNKVNAPKIQSSLTEAMEGSLVQLKNVWLVDANQWTSGMGNGFTVKITNGNDVSDLHIHKNTDVFKMTAPKGKFNVTGIVIQDDNSAPYDEGYALQPRNKDDFEFLEQAPVIKLRNISELKANDSKGMPLLSDSIVKIKGIISCRTANFSSKGLKISMYDATGGVIIFFDNKTFGYAPSAGDSIMVTGKVGFDKGVTQVVLSNTVHDTIIKINSGNSITAPRIVKNLDENTESELIELDNLKWVDAKLWTKGIGKDGFTVKAYRGLDTFDVFICNSVDLYNMDIPYEDGHFDIVGIGSQHDEKEPFNTGYRIIPRNKMDITSNTSITSKNPFQTGIRYYPNPASNQLNIEAPITFTQITIKDFTGRVIREINLNSSKAVIDVNNLSSGIYLINVSNSNYTATHKFIKN